MRHGPERGFNPAEYSVITTPPGSNEQPEASFDVAHEIVGVRSLSETELSLPPEKRRELRRERLESLKTELNRQQQGIADLIAELRSTVENDPNAPVISLKTEVARRAENLRLNDLQRSAFEDGIQRYEQIRHSLEQTRADYPDDHDLYAALLGRAPTGQVRAEMRPMDIALHCKDPNDFAYAATYGWHHGNPDAATEVLKLPDSYKLLGCALQACQIPELESAVIVLNETALTLTAAEDVSEQSLIQHEEEHIFQRLFNSAYPFSTAHEKMEPIEAIRVQDGEPDVVATRLLDDLTHKLRGYAGFDDSAVREILALYKEGLGADDIVDNLTRGDGFILKYLGIQFSALDDEVARIKSTLPYLQEKARGHGPGGEAAALKLTELSDEDVCDALERSCKGLDQDIVTWTRVIPVLESKGYGREETIHLLYQQPVASWLAFAHRLPDKGALAETAK